MCIGSYRNSFLREKSTDNWLMTEAGIKGCARAAFPLVIKRVVCWWLSSVRQPSIAPSTRERRICALSSSAHLSREIATHCLRLWRPFAHHTRSNKERLISLCRTQKRFYGSRQQQQSCVSGDAFSRGCKQKYAPAVAQICHARLNSGLQKSCVPRGRPQIYFREILIPLL